ncbi:aminotransferase class I/II-fold pyridoxal phosphate-dependent enzyme [Streptomyces sp. NBC_01239]|uniref:GntG family PLP-dependent aldolase n=1 Tax=Streptomyces sp. NBC_01239 TaxID=2903792 RepID=UPI0022592797|nr:GntG family PLP-dependent aldolase [Streptomyces sp. NBC_01239]MCX4816911.1 aminotransferase class I/II-fold pyridoxal phosphate-dependent enzyme [Streptomyces sp. NBC_01239]
MTSTDRGAAPAPVVELRSDTFTLPTPRMLTEMTRAPLGDDVYGEDPTARELEELAARLLGMEDACFMPSGTMGNLAALLAHCPRGTKALTGAESDIYVYEAGGASYCGGVIVEPVPNRTDGTMALADLEAGFPEDPEDPQFALPAVLCVENPQNRCGGRVLPLEYLAKVRALARSRGVAVHLDGARLFNAALVLGVPVHVIAGYADSVQFCLSKGLSAPVGSMVAGSAEFVRSVRRIRKMLGGGMRQAGVLAAAGLVALREMTLRLGDDHATARRLAEGLAALPGVVVEPVETNMVFFRVDVPGLTQARFIERAWEEGVRLAELGHGRIRAVTHAGVDDADVDRALAVFQELLLPRAVAA